MCELPLIVTFKTTVHKRIFHEIPELARFFLGHTDVVGMASFKLPADTGRARMGHSLCHSYIPTLVVNWVVCDVIDDETLFARLLNDFRNLQVDQRSSRRKITSQPLRAAGHQPIWCWHAFGYATKNSGR